ncbi:MAG TPA: alpha-L-arabinofuranosidase C-terminal domain-containing protein [Pyrinomonadaceae bacterium]
MKRRDFLIAGTTGGAILLGSRRRSLELDWRRIIPFAAAVDSRIEVLIDEPVGTIAPEIYGHFAEHLGAVIYDGIWVGENSKIANIGGIRKSLVDAMKKIRPGLVRWPGGCFADSYDWRDGIGPKAQRPRRTNFWRDAGEWPKGVPDGPWKHETNQFGTDDFVRFCRLVGAEPYIAANVRSLSAKDFYQWVEYCNSPAGETTLADVRAASGQREAYNVRFWGVGNESWGCGGNLTPEEYSAEYRRFTAWVPGYGVHLAFIGSGPNGGDLNWTRGFFSKLAERNALGSLWGWGLHDYSWNVSGGRTNDWRQGKGDALNYPDEEWYELLDQGDQIESLITNQWVVMGESDRAHRIKLVVDEWGAWYRPGTEAANTHLLGQQSTIRDAVLAGLTLDTFNRHAEKVGAANIAQLVNCLQSLFLAYEDKFVVTPTYHVFDMYSAHQRGKSLRTIVSSPRALYTRNGQAASIRALNGSASLHDRRLTLTVTNGDLKNAREAEIALRGATIKELSGLTLTASDIRAHNSFENARNVEPKAIGMMRAANPLVYVFPPASVTRLDLGLA